MTNRTLRSLAVASGVLASLMFCQSAQAYCFNEKIGQLVLVGENIYFTTDKTCASWCQVPTNWSADARNRVYSLLLTAKTTNTLVSFNWPTAPSACAALPTYSAFDQVFLAN
ncbi:MAG TPA: hypothetical protein VNZ85_02450 [Caulobacter sp.]|nr:hypothetical protein [Caulobacter sp.]